jgi:hypothetical protein
VSRYGTSASQHGHRTDLHRPVLATSFGFDPPVSSGHSNDIARADAELWPKKILRGSSRAIECAEWVGEE